MKVHKVTLYVIDHDRVGAQGVSDALVVAGYPNRCVRPHVLSVTTRDCGKWDDSHPLSHEDKAPAEIARLFAAEPATRFSKDMDGYMEPDQGGQWVRWEDVAHLVGP